MKAWAAIVFCTVLVGCGSAGPEDAAELPSSLHAVTPITAEGPEPIAPSANAPAANLEIRQGQAFSYALPEGWRVGEDGQFALTLVAPDNRALTVMVGNAGMPINYPPAQFVYEKLMVLQPQNLQVGNPRPVQASNGFSQAYEFDVRYVAAGVPCQGVVKCHIAPAYDSATMAMTAALSTSDQWPSYASWLPLVADQVSASNGAAFGMRGIMAQNLRNSTEYARAAQQYRDWSQKNWQQVTDQRGASQDRNNAEFREAIGGVQTYDNPYEGKPVQLPDQYNYYWVNEQGQIGGTNDPSVDPNVGSTNTWKQMPRQRPQ